MDKEVNKMSAKAYFDEYEERTLGNISVLVLIDKKEKQDYQLKDTSSSNTTVRTISTTDGNHTLQITQGGFVFETRTILKTKEEADTLSNNIGQLMLSINKKNVGYPLQN